MAQQMLPAASFVAIAIAAAVAAAVIARLPGLSPVGAVVIVVFAGVVIVIAAVCPELLSLCQFRLCLSLIFTVAFAFAFAFAFALWSFPFS